METISKEDARSEGLTYYFTGRPCRRGHLSTRRVVGGACVQCAKEARAKWGVDNIDRRYEWQLAYYKENRPKILEKNREWMSKNSDYRKEYERNFRKSDIGRACINSIASKRRSAKIKALPAWSNLEAISRIYLIATSVESISGIKVDVDHYYPIQGVDVCGLHVPENLRIITEAENCVKSNRHPDTWEKEKMGRGLTYTDLSEYIGVATASLSS